MAVCKNCNKESNLISEEPPKDPYGANCKLCVNECKIPKSEKGYCGLWKNVDDKIIGPTNLNISASLQ